MTTISKRRLGGLLAATMLAAILPGGQAAMAQNQETVVFAGWGGSIAAAQRKIYFDAFEKETGIKVIDVPDNNLAKIKAMVESGDVQWDVSNALGMWVPQGEKEMLWEKLDYSVIDTKGVPSEFGSEYGIGNAAYGIILAYNTKSISEADAPKNWVDFWNIEGKPGARGLQDAPRYTLEFALMADGVSPQNLYPLDVDRAFASLDKIKDKVSVWWKQWPQVPVLLASGELAMSNTSHTRIRTIVQEENVPLQVNWNQGLMTVDWLAVPRGAKNKENAMKLIAFMTRSDLQAKFAQETGIGPVNNDAFGMLSEEEKTALPSYHYQQGEMALFNNVWWADNDAQMIERWDAWKLQ